MMNLNMDQLYAMLSSNNSKKIQAKARNIASDLKMLYPLFQPIEDKSVWKNCAIVISEKSDDILENYLFLLLEWLQDINWPGAFVILNRLKAFCGGKLKGPFLKFVDNAIKLNNEEGLMWLDNLSELLDNEELKTKLPKDILVILQKHYHNWAWWFEE